MILDVRSPSLCRCDGDGQVPVQFFFQGGELVSQSRKKERTDDLASKKTLWMRKSSLFSSTSSRHRPVIKNPQPNRETEDDVIQEATKTQTLQTEDTASKGPHFGSFLGTGPIERSAIDLGISNRRQTCAASHGFVVGVHKVIVNLFGIFTWRSTWRLTIFQYYPHRNGQTFRQCSGSFSQQPLVGRPPAVVGIMRTPSTHHTHGHLSV